MAPLFSLAEMAIAWFVGMGVLHHFRATPPTAGWWWVLGVVAIASSIAGSWLGFAFSYHVAPEVIVHGWPVPIVIQALETSHDGSQQWVDFITPAPIWAAVGNTALLFCLPVGMVSLVHWCVSRKGQHARRPTTLE